MILDDIVAKVTDPYDRQARLYPALLCVLPLLTLIALYAPNVSALTRAVTITASCGGLFLITNICRELGKRIEEGLFQKWGGKPTTQLLRHRDSIIDSITKCRYHAFLEGKINVQFPNEEQEKSDPAAADETYQSGARWLLDHTRPDAGKQFDLLFREQYCVRIPEKRTRRKAACNRSCRWMFSVGPSKGACFICPWQKDC
jgi:hypothetical protein